MSLLDRGKVREFPRIRARLLNLLQPSGEESGPTKSYIADALEKSGEELARRHAEDDLVCEGGCERRGADIPFIP